MRSLRFPVRALMGIVLFCALGLAALKHPTESVARLAFHAFFLLVVASTLGAIAQPPGRKRLPWLGFAIAGWGYLWMDSNSGGRYSSFLPDTLVDSAYDILHPQFGPDGLPVAHDPSTQRLDTGKFVTYAWIMESLWGFGLASLGALLGWIIGVRMTPSQHPGPESPGG